MSFYSTFVPPILCTDLFLLHTAALSNLRRSQILFPTSTNLSLHPVPGTSSTSRGHHEPQCHTNFQFPNPNRKSKIPNPKSEYCFAEKKHTQNNIELCGKTWLSQSTMGVGF